MGRNTVIPIAGSQLRNTALNHKPGAVKATIICIVIPWEADHHL